MSFASYPQYEYLLASTQLFLIMLGTGATLSVADFQYVVRSPRSLILGLACQYLLSPCVAVLCSRSLGLDPGITVGLVLVAIMPGGALSKVFTILGKGSMALSISLTIVGTMGSLVTVPLLLRLFVGRLLGSEFPMPVRWIIRDVSLYLLTPLVLGMAFSRFLPRWRKPFSKVCVRLGLALVIVMVAGSIGSGRIRPFQHGIRVPGAIILYCVLVQQLGMLPFRLLKWPSPDRLAVGAELTLRNINLSLLLKALLFPNATGAPAGLADGVLFVLLFYAAVAMGAGAPMVLVHRRYLRRKSPPPALS